MWIKIKNTFLNILFPQFCLNCQKEGSYLCQDCQALLEMSNKHQIFPNQILDDLYWVCNYNNFLIKKLIKRFKYEPLIKDLSQTFASLIVTHLQLIDKKPDFSKFNIIPVPLHKKRLKWRGFNQAEELAKEIALSLNNPLILNNLIRLKNNSSQVNISAKKRKENVKNIFSCQKPEEIKDNKILLIDDVYTTGSTMEECARALKKNGAKEVIGVVIARE